MSAVFTFCTTWLSQKSHVFLRANVANSLVNAILVFKAEVFAATCPLKQCCNNDNMPPGLLKWSTQPLSWGGGGGGGK